MEVFSSSTLWWFFCLNYSLLLFRINHAYQKEKKRKKKKKKNLNADTKGRNSNLGHVIRSWLELGRFDSIINTRKQISEKKKKEERKEVK